MTSNSRAKRLEGVTLPPGVEPELISVDQACVIAGLGRTKMYELMANGTYYWDYYADGVRRSPRDRPIGRYEVLADGVIRFYMDPSRAPQSSFYAGRGYLFSTGHVSGDTMTVVYEDSIDFENEVYRLRR